MAADIRCSCFPVVPSSLPIVVPPLRGHRYGVGDSDEVGCRHEAPPRSLSLSLGIFARLPCMLHPSLSARSFPPVAPGECYTTYRGSGKELLVIGSSITALLPAVIPPLIHRCSGTRITGPIKRHIRLCIRATNYAHHCAFCYPSIKIWGFQVVDILFLLYVQGYHRI